MTKRARATLMLLVTMLIWGSTFVVTKRTIQILPPLQLAFVRVMLGALVLAPFAWMRRAREPLTPIPWRSIAWLGAIGVAFYYIAFNSALARTSAAQGALVQSCIPAVTALIAVLWLGERAPARRWIGIGLSIAGVIVVFAGSATQGATSSSYGNLLMFATVLAWGIYTSLAKRVAHCDTLVVTAGLLAVGAIMLLPFAAWEHAHSCAIRATASAAFAVIYLGCGASGIAYLFYNAALREVDANQAGTYTNLIPVVGVLSGVLLGDSLSLVSILGGVLVAVGVILTSFGALAAEQP
jgi:drug/metabolite transporter (DMT)-like permease